MKLNNIKRSPQVNRGKRFKSNQNKLKKTLKKYRQMEMQLRLEVKRIGKINSGENNHGNILTRTMLSLHAI